MLKQILPLLLASAMFGASWAQDDAMLRDDHPQTYTVVEGDTLWDISSRFLNGPWQWPEIWQVNQKIENPHLIYPGDVLYLTYVDGRPRLNLDRGGASGVGRGGTVKLSPRIRAEDRGTAIATVDLDALRPFFDDRVIMADNPVERLPYVVALEERHLVAGEGQLLYVRNMDAQPGDVFSVLTPTVVFREIIPRVGDKTPQVESREWRYEGGASVSDKLVDLWRYIDYEHQDNIQVLGYEMLQVGTAQVVESGDPSTLMALSSDREIMAGDVLMPVFSVSYDPYFTPKAPAELPENSRVIGLSNAVFGVGTDQVVAINRGTEDGIVPGDVLAAYRPGETMRDTIGYPHDDVKTFFSPSRRKAANVTIPDEYAAHIMVFKTFDRVSYAIVMRSKRAVRIGDNLEMP